MDKTFLTGRYQYEFEDGDTCEMSLTFAILKLLASKNKAQYEAYNEAMRSISCGKGTEMDNMTILYTAYCCANMNGDAPLMGENEFLEKCGSDREAVSNALSFLTNPKKKKASANLSD